MERIAVLVSVVLLNLNIFSADAADGHHVDSLRKVLSRLPGTFAGDTARVNTLVEIARSVSDDKLAIAYLDSAMRFAHMRNWSKGIMIVTCRTGFHFGRMSLDYRACEYLFKGLRLAEVEKNEAYIGFAYRYLGDNHSDLGLYHKGLAFQLKALPHLKKGGDMLRYLTSIHNIGLDYLSLRNYDKAIQYFNTCLQTNAKYRLADIEGMCLTDLAVAYERKGMYDLALKQLQKYKTIKVTNPDDLSEADIEIARIYLLKGDANRSLEYARLAMSRRGRIRTNTSKSIHDIMYRIFEKKGKYRLAFDHLVELTRLRALNATDMQKKQLESLKFYYENEKQKADIELLNKDIFEKNLQRRLLVSGLFGGGIFIAFLSIGIVMISRKSKKIELQRNQIETIKEQLDESNQQLLKLNESLEERVSERTIELERANQELIKKNNEIREAYFNGQTIERKRVASELHDNLGGTIAALKWQFESIESEGLSEQEKVIYDNVLSMMEVAYSDVRNISHNLMPAELEKDGLSAALENMARDFSKSRRIDFSFSGNYVAGSMGKQKEMELYSICLELVTNILKHSRATTASIVLNQQESNVILTVSDNGIGMNPPSETARGGMGLRNLHNRLKELNAIMEILTLVPNGTSIQITLALPA